MIEKWGGKGILTVSLPDYPTVRLSECLTFRLSDCLSVWLPDYPSVWLSGCQTAWLSDCPNCRLSYCLTVWLSDCQTVRLCSHPYDWGGSSRPWARCRRPSRRWKARRQSQNCRGRFEAARPWSSVTPRTEGGESVFLMVMVIDERLRLWFIYW